MRYHKFNLSRQLKNIHPTLGRNESKPERRRKKKADLFPAELEEDRPPVRDDGLEDEDLGGETFVEGVSLPPPPFFTLIMQHQI